MIVFLNKCDMVPDAELIDLVEEEVRELLTKQGFDGKSAAVIRGSGLKALESKSNDDEWAKKVLELANALDALPIPTRDLEKPFLMPVEDIFSIEGRGTVVTGRIERGVVKVGEEIECVGLVDTVRNTQLLVLKCSTNHFRKVKQETTPEFYFEVLRKKTFHRGQVLAKPKSVTPHTEFMAEVYILKKEEGGRHTPFFSGYKPQFYVRTTDVTGDVTLNEGVEMVMPGDTVTFKVKLVAPVALEDKTRFAIREGGKTVGAGVVTKKPNLN
jgi:elongation factor Tu